MQAVRCHGWCAPDFLIAEEIAPPPLRPHEARIRVHAAGVNFADTLMIAGKYQRRPALPFTPGVEAAGEIAEIGPEVPQFRVGQRVLGYFHMAGAFAEEAAIDETAGARA